MKMTLTRNFSSIKAPVAEEFGLFEAKYHAVFGSEVEILDQVLSHLQQRKGKMMRPLLTLLVAKLLGSPDELTYDAAISLELLHNASLMHDDVVDASDERRGQPSTNSLFGNRVAILSGDYLFSASLQWIARTGRIEFVDTVATLGQDLAKGELLQLSVVQRPDYAEADYFEIIRKKTAALFTACARLGALSVGADSKDVSRLTTFAENIGLCFQIKDDIFDYFDEGEIGKPTGNDLREGKITLPLLHALQHSQDAVYQQLAEKVKAGCASTDDIGRLISFTRQTGGIGYAVERMYQLRDDSLQLLSTYPDSDVKTALATYFDFVIERSK